MATAAIVPSAAATIADTLQREAARRGGSLPGPASEVAAAVLALWRGLLQQRLLDPEAVSAPAFTKAVTWLLQSTPARTGEFPARVSPEGS